MSENISDKINSNIDYILSEDHIDEESASIIKDWMQYASIGLWLTRFGGDGNTLVDNYSVEAYISHDTGILEEASTKITISEMVDDEIDCNIREDGTLSSDSVGAFARLADDFEREATKIRALIAKSKPSSAPSSSAPETPANTQAESSP